MRSRPSLGRGRWSGRMSRPGRRLSLFSRGVGALALLGLGGIGAGCSLAEGAYAAGAAARCPADALGCVEIVEPTGTAQNAPVATFGQPFPPGALPAVRALAAFDP